MLHFHHRWLKRCQRRRGETHVVQSITDRDSWSGTSTAMWSGIGLSFKFGPVILWHALSLYIQLIEHLWDEMQSVTCCILTEALGSYSVHNKANQAAAFVQCIENM